MWRKKKKEEEKERIQWLLETLKKTGEKNEKNARKLPRIDGVEFPDRKPDVPATDVEFQSENTDDTRGLENLFHPGSLLGEPGGAAEQRRTVRERQESRTPTPHHGATVKGPPGAGEGGWAPRPRPTRAARRLCPRRLQYPRHVNVSGGKLRQRV